MNIFGLKSRVSFEQVRAHADLEGQLTDQILSSPADRRAEVVSAAYKRLYHEIDWLAGTGGQSGGDQWLALLRRGAHVYEVGSGSGYLCGYLNAHGVDCVRTDISAERNAVNDQSDGARITDGVRLSRFEAPGSYDFVISDQVVEHIHPDDLATHFSEARKILKRGGAYVFRAPNAMFGPKDLSAVFGEPKAVFMHLHEFAWSDVRLIVKACAYKGAKAVMRVPKSNVMIASGLYYRYLLMMEGVLRAAPGLKAFARLMLIPTQVWAVLETA